MIAKNLIKGIRTENNATPPFQAMQTAVIPHNASKQQLHATHGQLKQAVIIPNAYTSFLFSRISHNIHMHIKHHTT